ncbi:MAG TPA: type II CAAX endopeptidase family protein [Mucilaginibacter sp.]|jgi:hypothetical protein|nr:type II CAAX endopeptidase family protein [Mucilaginibacter sp.]
MIDTDTEQEIALEYEQDLKLKKKQYNAIILAGIGIALLFSPVVDTLTFLRNLLPLWRLLISTAVTWITLPVLYQYAVKVEGRPFLLWQEQRRNILFFVGSIIVLFILAFCAQFISLIPFRLGFHDDYKVMHYWHTIIKQNKLVVFFICISAGTTQELLMRGYILPRLTLLFKPAYLPVLLSALIFSLLHLGYGNLSECIFTFLFGLFCAVYYVKYQNISVLIVFHFLFDLLALTR